MPFVWMLFIGLVIGIVAKLLVPGRDQDDMVTTALLGVGGSLLAGTIGRELGWFAGPFEGLGLGGSILGAMLIIGCYRLSGRRRRSAH